MSSENVNRHKETVIEVCGFKLSVLSLDTYSHINLGKLTNGILPKTLFVDLCFEIESALGVRVRSLQLLPSDLRRPNFLDCALLIHDSIQEAAAKKI